MNQPEKATPAQRSGFGPPYAAAITRSCRALVRWIATSAAPGVKWGTFGFGAIFLAYGALLALNYLTTGPGQHLHTFGTFWASGWAASHHLNPYAAYANSLRFEDNLFLHASHVGLNLSPPPLLPLFQAIALFHPESVVKVWTFSSLALFIVSMALLVIEYRQGMQRRQILWFFLGPAALDVLLMGQDYALLLFLAVLAWLLFEHNREVSAGLFLAMLVAIKPNLVLWPVFLAICGHSRIAKACAVALLVLGLYPVLLYGPQIYPEWLRATRHDHHWIFFTDVSITGLATRLGHRLIGRILSVILVVGATVFVVRKRPSAETATGIAVCLGLLASPLAWIGYSLFLTPVLLRKPWSTNLSLALLPVMLPFQIAAIGVHTSRLAGILFGLFYFVPVCFMLAYFLRNAADESRSLHEPEKKNAVIMA